MRLLFTLLFAGAAVAAPHLENIRQLTDGGSNAEAYWSPDGKRLIYQSTRPPYDCDQIFIMNADGSNQHVVSTGKGRTTWPTSSPTIATSSMPQPMKPPKNVPRRPTAAKATSGASFPATTSISLPMTARSKRNSPPRRATTPKPPSTGRPGASFIPRSHPATSTSGP